MLARPLSYFKCTSGYRQFCHVWDKASECKLGLSQYADVAGYVKDSKSTSGGMLCIFGDHSFVPISLECTKQTTVSHVSTEIIGHWFEDGSITCFSVGYCD